MDLRAACQSAPRAAVNWLPLPSAALNKFINSPSLSASVILLRLHMQGMDC